MKYYIIRNKYEAGYLSRTLCRINKDNNFEIYEWYKKGNAGKWTQDKKYKKIFDTKDENYEIRVPTKREIDEVIAEIDDAAYDDRHTHTDDTYKDGKGRNHSVFIYQDYRSVDGYAAETGFEFNEIIYRADYDYFYDKQGGLLVKKSKESNNYYVLIIEIDLNKKYELKRKWLKPEECVKEIYDLVNNYDFKKLEPVTDFQKVLDYIDHLWLDSKDFYNIWDQKELEQI